MNKIGCVQHDCPDCKAMIKDIELLIKINNDLAGEVMELSKAREVSEPVAWLQKYEDDDLNITYTVYHENTGDSDIPVYTHPAKNEASSLRALSDDEIDELLLQNPATHREFARAIEAKIRGE